MKFVEKRPWSDVPIKECFEDLIDLKGFFTCLEPHPYMALGAPYGQFEDPWRLREDVVRRLLIAQRYLKDESPGLCFAIFDAWRPIRVQAFMFNYAITQKCQEKGIDPNDQRNSLALKKT